MRNPKWSRDELIVTLDFYFQYKPSIPNKKSSTIIQLSNFLNELGEKVGRSGDEKFRNQNGVYMKLMNFRYLDPTRPGGLKQGGKGDKEVWDIYYGNIEKLKKVSDTIKSFSDSSETDSSEVDNDDEEGSEGRLLTRVHKYRERNTKLVKDKKKKVFNKLGYLKCEVCDFNFKEFYGNQSLNKKEEEFIECHHTKPVSELKKGEKTKLSDLSLICSNCHRMIHRKKPWLSISELKTIIKNN